MLIRTRKQISTLLKVRETESKGVLWMRSKGIVFRVLFHKITIFHTKLKLYVTAVGYGPPMLPVNLGLLLV